MSEPTELRCVDGPMDGTLLRITGNVLYVDGYPDMAYVSTRPTDTNWRETYDRDWFMHGLDEAPPIPDRVLEWHERGWLSPEVRAIRGAILDASTHG